MGYHADIFAEGVRDKIFDTEMVATFQRALSDRNYYLRLNVVQIFTAAVAQGTLRGFYGDILTEIFAEGFRDKIFNTDIVAALGHALTNETSDLGSSLVEFFTTAVAEGALPCFDRIFILKYWKRGFGTRYLILRSSLHLDVHYPTITEAAWSRFSLLL
jgi:hypothetical protein